MKVGIIGCGNMGGALARGILSKKVFTFSSIYVSDKVQQKTRELQRKFGIRVSTNEEIAKKCNLIVIAVKPHESRKLFAAISPDLDHTKHIVSVMAGVTLGRLESLIKKKTAITRAMPNIAALAGKSITCLCHNKSVRQKAVVSRMFASVGEVMEIDEKYMDAVTAVSGNGPAYFFYLAENLRDAAIKMGIKKESAVRLAVATLVGSGAALEKLGLLPEALRECITSKRGTTEAAIRIFKKKNLQKIMADAVKAATRRSKEISKGA